MNSSPKILYSIFSTCLFAQKDKKKQVKRPQIDTSFIIVRLLDVKYSKTLIFNVGKKAKIFLSGDSILNEAKQYLSNDFVKREYLGITTFLDSSFQQNDTVIIESYQLQNLEYLVSRQLQNGNAKIFYNKHNAFVDTIFHRRERFGGHGDRFFYLPDKRAFLGVIEISGIIDNEAFFSGKYFQDYVKEGEKLASLRLE